MRRSAPAPPAINCAPKKKPSRNTLGKGGQLVQELIYPVSMPRLGRALIPAIPEPRRHPEDARKRDALPWTLPRMLTPFESPA